MDEQITAYIELGSNVGNRGSFISKALKMLAETDNVEVVRRSNLVETAPLGAENQPDYLNAVAEINTTLGAEDLHKKLHSIESSLGRVRREKWSPRTIDLDLLLFGRHIINLPDLTVPHPQMHLRSFVLSALCRLNAGLLHPVLKEPLNELAARLNGADFVLNPDLPQLVSVAGIIGVGKTTLTKRISDSLGCEPILELYDKNPFMPDVYAGKKELALDSQLYFLNSRVEQLNPKALTQGQIAVSDYVFDKELIYAGSLLNPQQLASYKKAYRPFEGKVAAPVLVIYLRDSVQKCLERIHKRNRPYEQVIGLQFLEKLSADYERLFFDWKLCPVIRISMAEFDCMRDGDIEHLANQIKSYVAGPSVIASEAKQSET
jgi:2-amino-4-hydroxy-6-hydroxymethyldihydropteridine diphosphokinase